MNEDDVQLARLCEQTADTAKKAAEWISRNKGDVGAKSRGLRREFRQQAELAKKYQRAATRPLCIGIFGPSQVGKSYLVSALARKGTSPLIARLDKERDFLTEINPEKEQEATGLVTRFSVHPTSAPASHPVAVRLLSHTDLVKILANTYFLDFKSTEERVPSRDEVDQLLTEAQSRAQASSFDSLTDVQVDDLRRYCEDQFAARRTTEVLRQTGYWIQLEEWAPRLPIAERVKLFSFLWGRLPEFTELYSQLYTALQSLNFANEAYCPIAALVPRQSSILDVNTLEGITNPKGDQIEVLGNNGRRALIARPYLTAIVAELVIQINEKPRDYFNYTDILDFPGARSRKQYENPESFVKKDGSLAELFRRGKVGYLFDHYCDEREITGMLLCMVPGNQEVHTLPDMVLSWIHKSHGSTPIERSAVSTALFLVLTKFDRRFEEAKGKDMSSDERWTTALTTTLTEFYGKGQDNWPEEWQPSQPFNNIFWLRNPNFIAPGLINYSGDQSRKETGLREPDRVAQFKQEYLSNKMIQRHFGEPAKAWEAAFSLNDGGVTYLADALSPVCKPELKRSQIKARVKDLRHDVLNKLKEYHVSDDGAAEERKRVAAAESAVVSLQDVIEGQRLGHLIAELQVESDELQLLFQRIKLSDQPPPDLPVPPWEKIKENLGLGTASPARSVRTIQRDRYAGLANAAMSYWADRLQALPQQARVLNFLRVQPEAMETIVRELLAGSELTSLGDQIAQEMRVAMPAVDSGAAEMLKPAMASAERINQYVWKLGQDALAESERAKTGVNGQKVSVFPKRETIDHLAGLPEYGEVYYQSFIEDWLASFLDLARRNASGGIKQKFSEEERALLKAIIQQLDG
ncbi:MAG: hypothetical protein GHHEDOFH_00854 [Pseudorhodoplanes sp.]|nr:hypothetical protein [Pseudorhodoplanes sp.]